MELANKKSKAFDVPSNVASQNEIINTEGTLKKLEEFVELFIKKFEEKLDEYENEAGVGAKPKIGKKSQMMTYVSSAAGATVGFFIPVTGGAPAGAKLGKIISKGSVGIINRRWHSPDTKEITRFFRGIEKYALRDMLGTAGGEIFRCFEYQFMQISDDRGFEKLALDAVDRAIQHLYSNINEEHPAEISSDLFVKAVIYGKSKGLFEKFKGFKLKKSNEWRTAHLYSNSGLFDKQTGIYYTARDCKASKYGYRLILNGEPIPERLYTTMKPIQSDYQYELTSEKVQEYIEKILEKMRKKDPEERSIRMEEQVDKISNTVNITNENVCKLQEDFTSLRTTTKTQSSSSRKQPFCNVLPPVALFTGREMELKSIDNILKQNVECSTLSQTVCISGLGGVGKSELARKYAFEYFQNKNAIWIDSETTESLKTSFHNIAEKLEIKTIKKKEEGNENEVLINLEDIVRDIYKIFVGQESLLIFDNAEDFHHIEDLMPWYILREKISIEVLITSRSRDWGLIQGSKVRVIPLMEFTENDAAEFVRKSLSIDNHDHDIDIGELCQILVHYPLALSQAIAYIGEKKKESEGLTETYYIKDYTIQYRTRSNETKNKFLNYQHDNKKYTETVYTTWEMTFKKFEEIGDIGRKAFQIAKMMAYLAPDDIPVEKYFLKDGDNGDSFRKAIRVLTQYSIIRLENGFGSCHRLVQEVLRLRIVNESEEEIILENALDINFIFMNQNEVGYQKQGNVLLSRPQEHDRIHVLSLWSYLYPKKYESLVEQFIVGRNREYREKLIYLLAKNDMNDAIQAIIKGLKQNKVPNYILQQIALRAAVGNECKNVISYLKPNDIQLKLCQEIWKAAISKNSNGLKNFLEILNSNPRKLIYLNLKGTKNHTPLVYAAIKGVLEIIELLLDYGAKPNLSIAHGPLYYAANDGNLNICEFFLNRYSTEITCEALHYALYRAIRNDHLDICKLLLDHDKVDVNDFISKSRISTFITTERGIGIYDLLLNHGLDINITDQCGSTLLLNAANYGYLNYCKYLIDKGADCNIPNSHGYTALRLAMTQNCLDIFKLLLNSGANINATDKEDKTALMNAADLGTSNQLEICQLLLDRGADLKITDCQGETVLFRAAYHNNTELCELLLDRGADLKVTDSKGETVLFRAAIRNNSKLCEMLLNRGADLNDTNKQKDTPLHYAVKFGFFNICEKLLDRGAEVNSKNHEGITPLMNAIFRRECDKIEICRLLLNHGADLNSINVKKDTALHIAAENGYLDICKLFLDCDADLNAVNDLDKTPLNSAMDNRHTDIFKVLLDRGAFLKLSYRKRKSLLMEVIGDENEDVYKLFLDHITTHSANNEEQKNLIGSVEDFLLKKDLAFFALCVGQLDICKSLLEKQDENEDQPTLLHNAACYGQLDICEFLLNPSTEKWLISETDINSIDYSGNTPLTYAAGKGYEEIFTLLLTHGAITNACNVYSLPPLHIAVYNGHLNICELLLKHDADPNYKTELFFLTYTYSRGSTALHLAVCNQQYEICNLLLRNNADANISQPNGNTSLHFAAYKGHKEICQLLINHKVNLNAKNKNGQTPLHLAVLHRHYEICDLLLRCSAEPNVYNEFGETPLQLVLKKSNFDRNLSACFDLNNFQISVSELLLYFGANLNVTYNDGSTLLHRAILKPQNNICKFLIDHGIDLETADKERMTSLHRAVIRKNRDICELLIRAEANCNAKDINELTPLHHSVLHGFTGICELLLIAGAYINPKDKNGRTPIHLAALHGNLDVCVLLLNRKANFRIIDKEGHSPLDLASSRNHSSICDLLKDR